MPSGGNVLELDGEAPVVEDGGKKTCGIALAQRAGYESGIPRIYLYERAGECDCITARDPHAYRLLAVLPARGFCFIVGLTGFRTGLAAGFFAAGFFAGVDFFAAGLACRTGACFFTAA